MATPVEEFQTAVGVGDVERARGLLSGHAEVRTAVNDPIAAFGSPPIAVAQAAGGGVGLLLNFGPRPEFTRKIVGDVGKAAGQSSKKKDEGGRAP